MYTEIIDGVIVCHTGEINYLIRENEIEPIEKIEMYDLNGNRFYSNFASLEEANKAIEELAGNGQTAVIGPKAPWRGPNGRTIPNVLKNDVGVYIVPVLKRQRKRW